MPSVAVTPTSYAITWGEVLTEPARVTASRLALVLTMGTVVAGPGLGSSLSADVLAAITDTLFASEAIVDEQGRPTRRYQQIWQNTIEALVAVLTSQGASIAELQAIWAGVNAAQSTASQAAQEAQATSRELALVNSFTNPVGVGVASNAGIVTISAHERVYGDGTTVSVNSGSVGGFASGDNGTVYYMDPARAGGAVTFLGTTNAVAQTGDTHVVWQGTIPGPGEADNPGSGPTAPGWTAPPDYDPRLIDYESTY